MQPIYSEYRDVKKAIRHHAAVDIQRAWRGYLSRIKHAVYLQPSRSLSASCDARNLLKTISGPPDPSNLAETNTSLGTLTTRDKVSFCESKSTTLKTLSKGKLVWLYGSCDILRYCDFSGCTSIDEQI